MKQKSYYFFFGHAKLVASSFFKIYPILLLKIAGSDHSFYESSRSINCFSI